MVKNRAARYIPRPIRGFLSVRHVATAHPNTAARHTTLTTKLASMYPSFQREPEESCRGKVQPGQADPVGQEDP